MDELGRRRAHTCQTEFTHTLPNGLLISLVVSDALTEGRNDEAVDALVAGDTTEGGQVTALGKVGHLAIKERLLILEALEASKGNVSLTARRLGVSRGKVYRALHDSRSGG
ncbi:helix-turn-helix domain-containing protein [Cupriavidus basilensis]